MNKYVNTSRIYVLIFAVAVLLVIYFARLYTLQMRSGPQVDEVLASATTSEETVAAARGDILDRYGTPLATTETSYNVTLSRSVLLDHSDRNDIIMDVIHTANEHGVAHTDTFPVTMSAPFTYTDMTDEQQRWLDAYIEFFNDLTPGISAPDLIVWMKQHYGISYTTPLSEVRQIIGVRYELEMRVIVNIDEYIFARDVNTDFLSILEEKNFPGVNVVMSAERKYCTEYAAHLLGYLGKITAEQYDEYRSLGYPMDAVIGQSGAEAAFEEYLHGVDGRQKVMRSASGSIISTEPVKTVQPGKNVYLTIDITLQEAAEKALANRISEINSSRSERDFATGGAVVVLDVNTSEALAVASYPTFDLDTLLDNYQELINDPANPVINRATNNFYSPGSTFKMAVGLAGLRAGIIDRWTTVYDPGYYSAYASVGYEPVCWVYSNSGYGHGSLDIVGALKNSCNVFFYWVGDHIGIDAIETAAHDFGFGEHTGIETGDIKGVIASVDYKRENFDEDWYAADTILASIGQSYNLFTPIQIANYTATIANGGTRHAATLLHCVKSADYSRILFEKTPETVYQFEGADLDYISFLQEGMCEVVREGGTAASAFEDYPVSIAAKTGTVQSDSDVVNNGVFVCYAPADNPEIAVAVVVEKGGSGSNIISVAKDVLNTYFNGDVDIAVVPGGALIP